MAKGLIGLGIWMAFSSLVIPSPTVASWNFWIIGMLGLFSGIRVARDDHDWQGTLAIIAGSCLFVAGFIPRFHAGDGIVGVSIIFGTLLFIAGVSVRGHHHHVPAHAAPRAH